MTLPLLLAMAFSGCLEVDGARILARDLARGQSAFAALPPDTAFGFAPAPGVRRILHATELKRLAAPLDLPLAPDASLCVLRATEPLEPARLIEAMRASLSEGGASVEIIAFSGFRVPRGVIEFPRAGLARPSTRDPRQPAMWKGFVRYDERRRTPIWAKVRVRVRSRRVVAARDLRAGEVIDAGWLRPEESDIFPPAEPWAVSVDQVAGRVLKAAVTKDSPVPVRLVAEPRAVERGDRVQVEASFGAATVAVVGEAESAGGRGDTVMVRNLDTGKRYRARVEGKGRVALSATPGDNPWDKH